MGGDGRFWEPAASAAQSGVVTLALTIYVVVDLWGGLPDGSIGPALVALVLGVGGGVGFAYIDVVSLDVDSLDEYVFLVTLLAVGLVVAEIFSPVGVPTAVSVAVLAFLWAGVIAEFYFTTEARLAAVRPESGR